jgi:hypothetical protein
VALLTALFATALLMALGLSVVLLGTTEVTLAAHDRQSRALSSASRAALTVAVADLQALPSWSALLAPGVSADTSASPGRFIDATVNPAAPWGGARLDLRGLCARLQAESEAVTSLGGEAPAWRLFEYGRLDQLVPAAARASPYYLVVWVADDRADGDGDPSSDANGIVVVRAVAYGPADGRAETEVSVIREPGTGSPDPVRILTIRPAH